MKNVFLLTVLFCILGMLCACAEEIPDNSLITPVTDTGVSVETEPPVSAETEPVAAEEAVKYTIPKLYLWGDTEEMEEKSDVRSISVDYYGEEGRFDAFAKINVQGTSSLQYDKKNYTINFFSDVECKNAKAVDVGWGEYSNYCLKANWVDKTHARNIVTAKIATKIQQKYNVLTDTPKNGLVDGYPIEIYVNGEFHGLYTWNIPKGEWQFGMDKDNPDHILLSAESRKPTCMFEKKAEHDTEDWDNELRDISDEDIDKLNRLIEFVDESDDETFKSDFTQYLDMDAAITYYIMYNFAFLPDNESKNMLLATYDGKVWYPSLYDMDASWGVSADGTEDYEAYWYGSTNKLMVRLEETFPEEISRRYAELRQDILSVESIMAEFDTFASLIPYRTMEKEKEKWGELTGYDYEQLESFLGERAEFVDGKMKELTTAKQ